MIGTSRYFREETRQAPVWLDDVALEQIEPVLPLAHGVARVNDRAVLSAIVHVLRTGILWRAIPDEYGVRGKTAYNRFVRWTKMGLMDDLLMTLTLDENGRRVLAVNADMLIAHESGELWAERGFFPSIMASA
ncbi:transposase [Acetobacter sicerae]|uniref:Transposase n=1 Tax=Acetobacter sicerae TaxID=85325 RepID=A0ABS8VZR7_9PROT|nr:transposase [Acetobacter sicerae]MCE0745456.1 transposase [Acetobacter sicerae]MCE0745467.1 transposase [Acetobacter sicerae]